MMERKSPLELAQALYRDAFIRYRMTDHSRQQESVAVENRLTGAYAVLVAQHRDNPAAWRDAKRLRDGVDRTAGVMDSSTLIDLEHVRVLKILGAHVTDFCAACGRPLQGGEEACNGRAT